MAKAATKTELKAPFQMGEKVFVGDVSREGYDITCPLCEGSKTATLNGCNHIEETIPCPYCKRGFEVRGTIHVFDVRPMVRNLTIGSVRYDDSDNRGPWSFMCIETGVGSGLVYRCDRIRRSEADATKDAEEQAQQMRAYLEQENLKRFSHTKRDVLLKQEYIETQALKAKVRELEFENARLARRLDAKNK